MAPLSTRDPFISADAARAAEGSGRVSAHMERCLAGVLTRPGKTAAELAAATGIDRRAASRRLPELRTAGLVVNGQPRTCVVTGRFSMTWFPKQEVRS